MSQCAEASFKLEVCGHAARDRDRDGIPCEKLCGKTRAVYQARVRAQAGRYPIVGVTGDGITKARSNNASGAAANGEKFRCSGKTRCKEMVSCAEATFYLQHCAAVRLDRNRDGIACSSLCR
ncbi:MAG: excalibur calcium-binding domain-containing protein [Hyphomicrobiaceae bacterium]